MDELEGDDWDDRDEPEEDEFEDNDESDTIPCPACGAEIYEDVEACPACGEYITHDTHPFAGRSILWMILGILGIAAVVFALALGP